MPFLCYLPRRRTSNVLRYNDAEQYAKQEVENDNADESEEVITEVKSTNECMVAQFCSIFDEQYIQAEL